MRWLSGQEPYIVILGGLEDLVSVKAREVAEWAVALYCTIGRSRRPGAYCNLVVFVFVRVYYNCGFGHLLTPHTFITNCRRSDRRVQEVVEGE